MFPSKIFYRLSTLFQTVKYKKKIVHADKYSWCMWEWSGFFIWNEQSHNGFIKQWRHQFKYVIPNPCAVRYNKCFFFEVGRYEYVVKWIGSLCWCITFCALNLSHLVLFYAHTGIYVQCVWIGLFSFILLVWKQRRKRNTASMVYKKVYISLACSKIFSLS